MHTGPGYICVCGIMHCLIESCVFQGEQIKHFSVCAKSTLSAFSEVLDDPPKYLNN